MVPRKSGTIVRIDTDAPHKVFVFVCLAADINNLPTTDVGTGSVAMVQDTGDRYLYHEDNGWVKWG